MSFGDWSRYRALLPILLFGVAPLAAQSPLDREVGLVVDGVTLQEALLKLRHDNALPLAWRGDLIPPRRVTVTHEQIRLGDLLAELLAGASLEARVTAAGVVVLTRSDAETNDVSTAATLAATGIQLLDQLVVTGSPVAVWPEREQPTAVTVITQRDMTDAPHRRFADQLRTFMPGLVSWDRGGVGFVPLLGSTRGVASFTSRAPKVYVDGVEVASPELFTLLDGRMVSGVELTPGPQGAALYGPDAIQGVLQIETRKGEMKPTHSAPRGALGSGVQGPTVDGATLWGEAAGGLEAGNTGSSLEVLGSLLRLGDEGSAQSDAWRLQGGGALRLGDAVRISASARAASYGGGVDRFVPGDSAVRVQAASRLEEHGLGVKVLHTVSPIFSQSLVAGTHWISGSREPFRSPILAPRLPLGATNETASRQSLRWAGTLWLEPVQVSAGVEVSRRELLRSLRANADVAGLSTLYREALDSRGGFAQLRGKFSALTLTIGARSDFVSSVGTDAARPWAAMAGASWTTAVGPSMLRFRGAWGRALRSPEPGMSQALSVGQVRQEANPALLAERQEGVEFGSDFYFDSGAWIRFTWFAQRASDLVQQVDLRRSSGTTRTYQFQNVGALTNRGVELDAGARAGRFAAAARLNLVSSRVAALSPTYAGEFEVDDVPLEVPRSTGSLAIRYEPGSLRFEVGTSWIGPWTGYDWKLVSKVGQGVVQARTRDREYWLEYSGVLRPFLGIQLPLVGGLSAWGRAETPWGSAVTLRDNLSPALGRTIAFGLELN